MGVLFVGEDRSQFTNARLNPATAVVIAGTGAGIVPAQKGAAHAAVHGARSGSPRGTKAYRPGKSGMSGGGSWSAV